MPFELRRKEITICGETLVVHQASNLMDSKRALMISEASERWKGQVLDEVEAQARRYLETLLYPSLAACTTGPVPTLDEFLGSIPAVETEIWATVAQALNPRWFPDLTERTPEEEAEELKKSTQPPTNSSVD